MPLTGLAALAAECVSCVIENVATTSKTGSVAVAIGQIRFKSVTVSTPANCTVADDNEAETAGQITTVPLEAHADLMNGTTEVWQFLPKTGTTFAVFTLKGASCGAAGTYAVKGTLFGDVVNATGVAAPSQEVRVNPTIQTNDGGALTIGTKAADLTGTGVWTLASGGNFLVR